MNLLTEKAILFLEEDGFYSVSNFGHITFFKKDITDHISIRVNDLSVILSITPKIRFTKKYYYYFDEIQDSELFKNVINNLQINPEKLISDYKRISFDLLNENEKYLLKQDVCNSIEFVLNPSENEFIDDNGITISFDTKNKLYSDKFGFALYKKMPF